MAVHGVVVWLVVINEDDERRRMSSFIVWLPRRTWWVSERRLGGSCRLLTWAGHNLVAVVLTCHRPGVHAGDVVLYRRSGGGCGWSVTTDVVCRRVAVCRQHPRCVAGASLFWMVVGDGWRHRWWWWEGRSGVAMFEPRLPYLG